MNKAVKDEFTNMVLFQKFMFMCFDHIGFFLFADHKLPRILGKKPGWTDQYTSVKKIVLLVIKVFIVLFVVGS